MTNVPNDMTINSVSAYYPQDSDFLTDMQSDNKKYQDYLNDCQGLSVWMSKMTEDSWSQIETTDGSIQYQANSENGVLTAYCDSDPVNGIYSFRMTTVGSLSSVVHEVSLGFEIAAGGLSVPLAVVKCIQYVPKVFSKIATYFQEAGNEAAQLLEGAAGQAEDAAADAGIALAEGVSELLGAAGLAIGISALILTELRRDLNLNISVINRSSKDYVVLPNYYQHHGSITVGSDSLVTVETAEGGALPPYNSDSTYLYLPHRQQFPLNDGSGDLDPNVQASEVDFTFQHDGLAGIENVIQLVEVETFDSASNTATTSGDEACWVALLVNVHYEVDKKPAVFGMYAGKNDFDYILDDVYDAHYKEAPVLGLNYTSKNAIMYWTVDYNSPPKIEGSWTWNLTVTIQDK